MKGPQFLLTISLPICFFLENLTGWKTQTFRKETLSRHLQNILAYNSSSYRVWQISVNKIFTLHKVFWQFLWRMGDLFCNTQEVGKNKSCWQKGYSSNWRNPQSNFFFYCRVWQTSRNNFFGFTRSFETYCAKNKMFSLGSRRPINKFFKKKLASSWKKVWYFFLVLPTMADIGNLF